MGRGTYRHCKHIVLHSVHIPLAVNRFPSQHKFTNEMQKDGIARGACQNTLKNGLIRIYA